MTMNYPHTALFMGESRTVTITGPHIHVLDTQSGAVLRSTAAAAGSGHDASPKNVEPIRCAAVSKGPEYLATTGDDKILRIWDLGQLVELSARELPKKPTSLYITKDASTIVVADKFGDVFSYPLIPPPADEEKKTERQQEQEQIAIDEKAPQKPKLRGTLTSHENPSDGTLILGHTSMLNAMLLSDDERYIFTADRDEHIRVSHYPRGWDIERYCLGHKKYVSAIHVPSFDSSSSLVSGGGDPMLKIWDWMQGKVVREIEGVEEAVRPFIKVRAKRKQRLVWNIDDGEVESEDAGGEGFKQGGKRGRRAKKRVAKAKALAKLAEEEERTLEKADNDEEEADKEDVEDVGDDGAENDRQEAVDVVHAELATDPAIDNDLVLVINKIDSFRSSEGVPYIVFCAAGATALFIAPYAGSSPTDSIPNSQITSFDLKQPVLDFVIGSSNLFWVSTDPNYDSHPGIGCPSSVRLLHWTASRLEEVTDVPSLLVGLNNHCNVPATAKDLKTLDLYADLNSMPKYHDASSGAGGDDGGGDDEVDADEREGTPGAKNNKPATKRMLGRLKNKRALEQLTSSAGVTVMVASDPGEGVEDRNVKRLKEDLVEQQDVEMT